MKISIACRYKPFSHSFGANCLIPGSEFSVEVFPALIKLYKNEGDEHVLQGFLEPQIEGPVKNFTVMLDLEKNCVSVWGDSAKGYFRYHINSISREAINIHIEKSPEVGLEWQNTFPVTFDKPVGGNDLTQKRLFLGGSKLQNWELVHKRQDIAEIFPHVLRLASLYHQEKTNDLILNNSQLAICAEILEKRQKLSVNPEFMNLYNAGFSGILNPRSSDEDYQGFSLPVCPYSMQPLQLLFHFGKMIEEIFYKTENNSVSLLPCLPPELHSGRFCNVPVGEGGILHFEWTKKKIRRMMLYTAQPQTLHFNFGNDVKKFRLRVAENDRGKRIMADSQMDFEGGVNYLIDSFE